MSAVRQATLRLSLRAGFLKKREKLRTPRLMQSTFKEKPRYTSPLKWRPPEGDHGEQGT